MKALRTLLVLSLLLGGCGGCEHESPSTGGGTNAAGGAGAKAPAGGEAKIQVTPLQPSGAAKQPGAPGEEAGGAPVPQAQDEADCIVIADANPDYGPPPLNVEFTAEAECTAGEPSYKWDFGDGTSGTEANPKHSYTKAGDFTATVTVTAGNATATDEIDITVEEGEEPADQ